MLTVIIKTKNSENFLCNVLEGIKGCEIIILDEHSTDDTISISKEYSAKIIFYNPLEFKNAFNQAVNEAKNDWILFLEDREIIPDKLLSKILKYIQKPKKNRNAISLAIQTIYLKKEIKSARNNKIKFFKKGFIELNDAVSFEFKPIKTKIYKINKNFKDKNCYILKFINENIIERLKNNIDKINLNLKMNEDIKNKKISLFFKPLIKFIYLYFLKGAIFDGKRGFIFVFEKIIDDFILNCIKIEKKLGENEDDI